MAKPVTHKGVRGVTERALIFATPSNNQSDPLLLRLTQNEEEIPALLFADETRFVATHYGEKK